MPKIKPTDIEAKRRVVRSCIARGMEAEAVTPATLASKARFSKETFYNRRKRPELYTLQELWAVVQTCKLTDGELIAILRGKPLSQPGLAEKKGDDCSDQGIE